MRKMVFLIGATTGYVLGARAGRERYDQICGMAGRVRGNPQVQNVASTVSEKGSAMAQKGTEMAHTVAEKAQEKAPDWVPGIGGDSDSATAGSGMPSSSGAPATTSKGSGTTTPVMTGGGTNGRNA
jgi:hypothetical protein